MLLSFSVPSMLPMIRAGLRQRAGEDIGAERVKRQTIRRRGPRAEQLLAHDPIGHTIARELHLWWKSRTPEKAFIGKVGWQDFSGPRVYPINILHSRVEYPDGRTYPVIRIDGPRGWRNGDAMLFWHPGEEPGGAFEQEARADGFDSPEAFRDYFVPNMGDRFDAILFKW